MNNPIRRIAANQEEKKKNSQYIGLIFIFSGSCSYFSSVRKDEGTNNGVFPLSNLSPVFLHGFLDLFLSWKSCSLLVR